MSVCPIIEIFPDAVSVFADSNGRILLDVDERTSVSLSKGLENYDEILTNEILGDIVLNLPRTPKNFFYLKHLYDPAVDLSNGDSMPARITTGSDTFMHETLFGVTKSSDDIQIRLSLGEAKNWIERLKDTLVRDIELPQIDFTKADIDDKWANNKAYADGDPGYWYPLVFYGAWRVHPRKLVVEDLRPFLHALYLLQKMFAHIGWCFNSPFYETDFGRSLNCYLLKKDYGNTLEQQRLRAFYAQIHYDANQEVEIGHVILKNWTEHFDYGNNFNDVTGIYTNGFEGKIKLKVVLGLGSGIEGFYFELFRRRFNPIENEWEVERVNEDQWVVGGIFLTGTNHFNFEVDIVLLPDEELYLSWTINNEISEYAFNFPIDIYFSNEVTRAYTSRGDIISMNNEVDEDMTCLDLFRGLQHLISGITESSAITRSITLWTPYAANIFGEEIDGYYNNTLVDLVDIQPSDSTKSALGDTDKLRYIRLAFAKSTDNLFKTRRRADGTEFYSKTIDLGSYFKNDSGDDRNPLFEGTDLHSGYIVGINTFGNHEPFTALFPSMIDNDDAEISYNIKPRILYNKGFGRVNTVFNFYRWEDEYISNFAFAFNHPGSQEFDGQEIEERLLYGDEANDLWSLVYSRFYLTYNGKNRLDILVSIRNNQFFGYDFKNAFQIEMDGHPIMCRLLQINDFRPCDGISTPMILMPELVTGPCINSDDVDICGNAPIFVEVINGNCRTFSIAGDFDCNVTSISWEMRAASETEWTDLGSSNTVEICDIPEAYQVRATIEYDCDECDPSIITKWFFPCTSQLNCTLTPVFTAGGICLEWDYTSDFPVDGCDFTATLSIYIDGELDEVIILDIGQQICPIIDAFYILELMLDCDNGCPALTATCTFTGSAPPLNQCQNYPILQCIPVSVDGVICYEFTISGSIQSEIIYFVVTIECDGETFTWMQGDDPICCSGTMTAKAMVHFCDCPSICTESIQCEGTGCVVFNPGTALQIAVCN